MFALVLLSLLAFVSAQDKLCDPLSNSDLAAAIVADIDTISRDLDLRVNADFSVTASSEAEYNDQVNARFSTDIELSAQASADIDAAVQARLDAVVAAFPVLQRDAILLCLTAKKALIDGLITAINEAVTQALTDTYNAFKDWQLKVKAAFDAWVSVIANADVKAIVDAQISVNTQRAIQLAGDVTFYVNLQEQKQRELYLNVSTAVYAYLVAVKNNVGVDAARAEAEVQVRAVIIAAIDLRRAQAIKAAVTAEIEAIKERLKNAEDEAKVAAQRAYTEVRAALIAAYQDTANKIEEYRARIAEYLAGIRCDASTATITVQADSNQVSGDLTIQVRGIKCYDTSRSEDDRKALFCASLKAYFIAEGATAKAETYGCAIVNAKRSLQQSSFDADMTASDPNGSQTSSSTSVVACLFALLFAMLFHF